MAPNSTEATGVLYESDAVTADLGLAWLPVHKADNIKRGYKWHSIAYFVFLHVGALYGAYLIFVSAKWQTDIFALFMYVTSLLGITAGAHRLWSHKAYKAKWPLRLILAMITTAAGQGSMVYWVRLHRTHHKYSDTDADPHNASRGFFFSHFGWSLVKEHPEFLRKSSELDLSDLYSDPIIYYQDKYYWVLFGLLGIIAPTLIPVYFWNESLTNAFFVATMFRIASCNNVTACINSVAHLWGNKPYDGTIKPTETFMSRLLTFGEGSHNYHHTFPWDYKTSEFSIICDFATHFIYLFSKIGWAYDLKTVSKDIIQKRLRRTGDGSHPCAGDEATRTDQKSI